MSISNLEDLSRVLSLAVRAFDSPEKSYKMGTIAMKIKQLLEDHIKKGEPLKLHTQNGKEGALLTDRGEFIPLDDLGYSSEMGFYRVSDFPFLENEAA